MIFQTAQTTDASHTNHSLIQEILKQTPYIQGSYKRKLRAPLQLDHHGLWEQGSESVLHIYVLQKSADT